MSFTRLVTMVVKAAPMMMPTARSMTLPRMMKALNSFTQAGCWGSEGGMRSLPVWRRRRSATRD